MEQLETISEAFTGPSVYSEIDDWMGAMEKEGYNFRESVTVPGYKNPDCLGTFHTAPILIVFMSRPKPWKGLTLAIPTTLEDAERRIIERTVEVCKGHRTEMARILGISPRTLYRKLHQYRILKQRV